MTAILSESDKKREDLNKSISQLRNIFELLNNGQFQGLDAVKVMNGQAFIKALYDQASLEKESLMPKPESAE
jgi:hypothetical protein